MTTMSSTEQDEAEGEDDLVISLARDAQPVKRRSKRKLTEQRRLQNKIAQKKFRDKQKLRFEELEKLASSNQQASGGAQGNVKQNLASPGQREQSNAIPFSSSNVVLPIETAFLGNMSSEYQQIDAPLTSDNSWQNASFPGLQVDSQHHASNNHYDANAILQWPGDPSSGLLLSTQLDGSQQISPEYSFVDSMNDFQTIDIGQTFLNDLDDIDVVQILQNAADMERAKPSNAFALKERGLETHASTNQSTPSGSTPTSVNIEMQRTNLPSVMRNRVNTARISIYVSLLANASLLGVVPNIAKDTFIMSIFYRPNANETDILEIKDKFSNVKENLRPTETQIRYPHFFWLDLIPFPSFRDRAIVLSTREPVVFDILELKKDICAYGVVCWGGESKTGSSTGSPWDMRSWEAQSWFLTKWWMLTGGDNGEMAQQAKWWRAMKGEE